MTDVSETYAVMGSTGAGATEMRHLLMNLTASDSADMTIMVVDHQTLNLIFTDRPMHDIAPATFVLENVLIDMPEVWIEKPRPDWAGLRRCCPGFRGAPRTVGARLVRKCPGATDRRRNKRKTWLRSLMERA